MAKKKIDYASMFTLRKDGRYQGSYTDEKGRHFVYDRDPERLWHKLNDSEEIPIITFGDVAEAWEKEHREQITGRTWSNYEPHYRDIVAEHGKKAITDVSALDVVNDLAISKAKGYSATVVNSRRSIYRMIFDYAIIHGHLKYNPVTAVKLPKGLHRGKRSAPTEEQMQTIFRSIDAPFGFFPLFLLCTGLRKSEALALKWDDIDFEKKEISITKSIDYTDGAHPKIKPPKTEAGYRTVPILDVLLKPLRSAQKGQTSVYVFPASSSSRGGAGGGLMSERAYEGAWLRYCKAAGLMVGDKPAITAHNLRHGTATLMFELGVDELTAQRILGHSRIEITREIYTELRNRQKIKSVGKLNAGMSEMMSKSLGCR